MCLVRDFPAGIDKLLTTDLLSPNMKLSSTGTPRHLKVSWLSMTCFPQLAAATNLEPQVAVAGKPHFFACQSVGVSLNEVRTPVADFPVSTCSEAG
jgi:hypothetical protein